MKTRSFVLGVLCVVANSFSARAALVSYTTPGGVDVVHSSVSNITWLSDANLLGGMISSRGFDAVVGDIIAAVPSVTLTYDFNPPQTHTIVAGDYFNGNGQATFYGAYAFVEYLNAISYGGTNQWRLPDAINTVYPNPVSSGFVKSGDIGQLYYDELNSPAGFGISDPLNYFSNEQPNWYWSSTLFQDTNIVQPFAFHVGRGDQYFLNPDFGYYVWPVANGLVPEPASALPFGLLLFAARRRVMR